MPILIKWLKRILGGLVIFIFLLLLIFKFIYNPFERNKKQILTFFHEKHVPIQLTSIAFGQDSLQVISTTNSFTKDSILVCFIHGAPGSSMDFKRYLSDTLLLQNAKLMAIDRPGYGNSSQYFENISRQAKDLMKVINNAGKYKRLILVGHSYGCPIAAEMAIQNREKVSKVIFLAGVIDPFHEQVFWYAKLFNLPLLNALIPKDFQSAIFEKINHKKHLLKLHEHWTELTVPILMIHGLKDTYLAPYNNVNYAKQNIPKKYLKLQLEKDKGHLIPFIHRVFTRDIILNTIKSMQQ